jgi:hypothetical protein
LMLDGDPTVVAEHEDLCRLPGGCVPQSPNGRGGEPA